MSSGLTFLFRDEVTSQLKAGVTPANESFNSAVIFNVTSFTIDIIDELTFDIKVSNNEKTICARFSTRQTTEYIQNVNYVTSQLENVAFNHEDYKTVSITRKLKDKPKDKLKDISNDDYVFDVIFHTRCLSHNLNHTVTFNASKNISLSFFSVIE